MRGGINKNHVKTHYGRDRNLAGFTNREPLSKKKLAYIPQKLICIENSRIIDVIENPQVVKPMMVILFLMIKKI